jgi:hypothetical protein
MDHLDSAGLNGGGTRPSPGIHDTARKVLTFAHEKRASIREALVRQTSSTRLQVKA